MSARILSTAISTDKDIDSSIEHAVNAGQKCIEQAGIDKNEIDILINVGIYRDENIGEPAIAPLVQKRLDINPSYTGITRTFSFDLINGAAGFLYAVRVINSMMKNGTARRAMIISSDMHPSQKQVADFPFTHLGAAVLLEKSEEEDKGFKHLFFRTSNDGYNGITGYCDSDTMGNEGRSTISIDVDNEYIDRLRTFTINSLKVFYSSNNDIMDLDPENLKVIMSVPIKGFAEMVKGSVRGLRDNPHPVICLFDEYGDPHSSALSIAFHNAIEQGNIIEGDKVLFIGAGAGLTVAGGIYYV